MAWWKKDKREVAQDKSNTVVPNPEAEPERYEGRPLLVILENYVLDSIGALAPDRAAGMTTIVQRVFGGGADWKKTVREKLELSDTIDAAFRQMWAKNQEIAKNAGRILHPVSFAKMAVDSNFASLIGPPLGR